MSGGGPTVRPPGGDLPRGSSWWSAGRTGGGRRSGGLGAGGWTRRVEERFLIALSETCNVNAAARSAGMSHSSAYAHRYRWPTFAREWDEAVAIGYAGLEAALIEGAIDFFEREPLELGGPIRVTSVGEAIQALTVNRRAVVGFGKGKP